MIKIAVLGYGTVGSGVVDVLMTNKEIIEKRIGDSMDIKYILDIREFPGSSVEYLITHNFDDIVNDEEVSVVAEVMGGIEPAYTFVKKCLLAGKSVVTSNKALVAKHGAELLSIASEKNINFLYEASVGGGIPIIRTLCESLTGDVIEEITGILNGTTNYMLTKMYEEGADYDAVLKEAQAMGYAERDPSADVEGHDACRKIAILTSLVTGQFVDFEDIHTEGISHLSITDIEYAKAMDMKIKLLATCKMNAGKPEVIVAPCLLDKKHPLYSVDDVFNAVFVKGNMLGDSMFYGSGAGKLPTASAVMGDIIEAAKNPGRSMMGTWSADKLQIAEKGQMKRRFFVRANQTLAEAMGDVQIVRLPGQDEVGFVTGEMTESALEQLRADHPEICQVIRIQD